MKNPWLIAAFLAVAMGPVGCYQHGRNQSKEAVLRNSLFTLRTAIDEYTHDKRKAPRKLGDLVNDGYLRQIPIDPMTGRADSWQVVLEGASNTVNRAEPGIFDVRSGSDGKSPNGSAYSDW